METNTLYDRISPKIFDLMYKINEQRHLQAIRTAFITTMPIMIAAAFAVAINNLPIPAYQDWMIHIFGEGWRQFGGLVYDSTMSVITLIAVYGICDNLAQWYAQNRPVDIHRTICGTLGVACYFTMALPLGENAGLSFSVTNVTGLFVGALVSVCACEMFIALVRRKKEQRILTEEPNAAIPQSFNAIVPALIVLGVFAATRMLMISFGVQDSLTTIVYKLMSSPFNSAKMVAGESGPTLGTAQIFNVFTHFFWTLGMHGNNVLEQVSLDVFVPAAEQNIAAHLAGLTPPNLYTKTMLDVFVYMGGSGATLSLVLALIICGKNSGFRNLMRYALPTSIFNINEPIIFGIPIVLNPVFIIPFILTPVIILFITAFSMSVGLVPLTIQEVNWTSPIFVSGYAATGSPAGSVLQLVNIAVGTLVYYPFVRFNVALQRQRFDRAYHQLCTVITTEYGADARKVTQRNDEVGAVARSLANNLQSAVNDHELFLVYQPIVDSRTNTMSSVEALLRWKHPVRGAIHPMLTITLAEEIGLIDQIGFWIIEESCAQHARWRDESGKEVRISVNISAQQLLNPRFSAVTAQIVEKYKVKPEFIQIEVTETLQLAEDRSTMENLRALDNAGIDIAIDDFGMGHSSLVYLRSQPISTLKVDGSLSRDILTSPMNLEIISSIGDLCKMLDVKMIIEVVETKEQVECLAGIGAYLIQGYYYSKPLLAGEIPGFDGILYERFYGNAS